MKTPGKARHGKSHVHAAAGWKFAVNEKLHEVGAAWHQQTGGFNGAVPRRTTVTESAAAITNLGDDVPDSVQDALAAVVTDEMRHRHANAHTCAHMHASASACARRLGIGGGAGTKQHDFTSKSQSATMYMETRLKQLELLRQTRSHELSGHRVLPRIDAARRLPPARLQGRMLLSTPSMLFETVFFI